jgi:hypothetical protein
MLTGKQGDRAMQYQIAFFQYGKTRLDLLKFTHNHFAEFDNEVAAQAYGHANSDEADGFQMRRKGRPTMEIIIKARPDA